MQGNVPREGHPAAENLWGNLPPGLYRNGCVGAHLDNGHNDAWPASLIIEPNSGDTWRPSGGATVLMMETADMGEGDDLSLLR